MKITPDTNVLVRAATRDDARQGELAETALRDADLIAVTLPALCELVWVLQRGRKVSVGKISMAIHELLASSRVETNRAAVLAGLANMEAGGDFADAVIAIEGRQLGGEVFVTFDRKAAALIKDAGDAVECLA